MMAPRFGDVLRDRNFSAALKQLDALIKEHPGRDAQLAALYCNRAWVYKQLGLLRKALKDAESALEVDPGSVAALVRRAQVEQALGKQEEAKATAQQALEAFSPFSDASLLSEAQAIINPPPPPPPPAAANAAATTPRSVTSAATSPASGAASISPHLAASGADTSPGSKVQQQRQQQQRGSGAAASANGGGSSIIGGGSIPDSLLPPQVIISRAVELINVGEVAQAHEALSGVIAKHPKDFAARLARGTARALTRDLQGAVDDFSAAIEQLPVYADAWKRRGQALGAMGRNDEALADLQKALELSPDTASKVECYLEKGVLLQKGRDFRAAAHELRAAVRLDGTRPDAWNSLGLCCTSQGDIQEGVSAYRKAVDLRPDFREAWVNMAHALKEAARVPEAEQAFERALSLDPKGKPNVQAMRLLAQMRQGCGDHRGAIQVLTSALKAAREEQRVELLYWRAVCYHALGMTRRAVEDYEGCYNSQPPEGSISEEARGQQMLAFYQRELALYSRHRLDERIDSFCPDRDLHPVFKELWCKKAPPTTEFLTLFQAIMQPPLPVSPPPGPPPPDPSHLATLLHAADSVGLLLQYSHQGFLPNKRQQRMAGLAAIELAQTLRKLVAARREGRPLMVNSDGASSSSSSTSCATASLSRPAPSSSGGGGSGGKRQHEFGWRDAMDVAVKWRQLSEPNDQVIWVDLLTKQEFEAGFGSHTPMYSGQTKCVRYYMNFSRALALHKDCLLRERCAYDAQNNKIPVDGPGIEDKVKAASSAEEVYQLINKDSWVVVHIHSTAVEGRSMEGTRLTLVKVPNQPSGYEFSIRTPVTPHRWAQFDEELAAAFDGLVEALVSGDAPRVVTAALRYAYYWYNFMPLARGTAVVGYITLLATFMAAGHPVTATIPNDTQTDWEAILAQTPEQFADAVAPWLVPCSVREASTSAGSGTSGGGDGSSTGSGGGGSGTGGGGDGSAVPQDKEGGREGTVDVGLLPGVYELLPSSRLRLEALNGPQAPRI